MAVPIARFLVTNLIKATASVLSKSSAATSNPVSNIPDQLRSKTWRSATGWTVITGYNDRLDFVRSGTKVAIIAAGTYATAAAYSTAIIAAFEAADATPAWDCAQNAGTKIFTISTAAHSFTMPFLTGASLATSAHLDLGYTTTDKTSAANAVLAEAASYQSRHWVAVDLGSAQNFTVGTVFNHNAGAGGTFTMKGSATSVALALSAPSVSKPLVGDSDIRTLFFTNESYRYVALEINNTGDADGYSEVGVWFLGVYTALSVTYSTNFSKRWLEYSTVSKSDTGSHFVDEKPRGRAWSLQWLIVTNADRVLLEAIALACPRGKCFILAFDATVTPTDTAYVYMPEGLSMDFVPVSNWTLPVPLEEALG